MTDFVNINLSRKSLPCKIRALTVYLQLMETPTLMITDLETKIPLPNWVVNQDQIWLNWIKRVTPLSIQDFHHAYRNLLSNHNRSVLCNNSNNTFLLTRTLQQVDRDWIPSKSVKTWKYTIIRKYLIWLIRFRCRVSKPNRM